ncbi:NAD(P)/FAD-dependent oxidoreductase [Lichenicoccus sp.]|uniref:NAD(P)/FAD-dependent oxidoreductase n=1 Tax=Lichenicoccus sp. TaxID=2781899 RepID=UPI003D13DFC6
MNRTALIIGAGQAGAEVATRLRQQGFSGRIVLIGAERHLPYARPPLSKAYLAGTVGIDDLSVKARAAYEKADIELRLSTRVDAIKRDRRTVSLESGDVLHYDVLILALGGRPRPMKVPGHELGSIFTLRNIEDVEAMRGRFKPGRRLVIVGGGYVGLEVAAVAIKSGLAVTVLEGADRVLARVTAPEMSAFYERVHRGHGVEIHTGVTVTSFIASEADPGKVGAVAYGEGSAVAADFVIVGIGLLPNAELAEEAGLVIDGGIVVDAAGRTTDPHIYAIGDCATHAEHGFLERKLRLESVPNAIEQAHACAAAICEKPAPKAMPPWFWSDQYHLKLQMVGLSAGYDSIVLRGTPESETFIAFYLSGETVIAADAVNRIADFIAAKRMVADHMKISSTVLADETMSLKTVLAAGAAYGSRTG